MFLWDIPLLHKFSTMTTKSEKRTAKFYNGDEPKYIRCYDNGGRTADRYTVVFTGRYRHETEGMFINLGFSENPYSPMGIGCFGETFDQIDRPSYSHLGKRIGWEDLSEDGRRYVKSTYDELWDLGFFYKKSKR